MNLPPAPTVSRGASAVSRIAMESQWYDLFSRGARDWLRHNQKVREAVKDSLPNLLSGADVLSRPENRTVLVPVRMLEHARFRLRDQRTQSGAGQGKGEPGDVLRQAQGQADTGSGERGEGGTGDGELTFMIELKIDDIVDWLWEELKLPDLKPKHSASLDDPDFVRQGWDRRGARSRLDRRRTVKEAIKRRTVPGQENTPFSNEDLRFRQLVRRTKPAVNAVVVFGLDVSGSMGDIERKLAKTFFFFALQGIRRQYARVETVFLAHSVEAWEFPEEQFFQVTGSGGTTSSSVFKLALNVLQERFDPGRYNSYLFYASDGENAPEDYDPAYEILSQLTARVNYAGYAEIGTSMGRLRQTPLNAMFVDLQRKGMPAATALVTRQEDVWRAIRAFFQDQASSAA
jgi:sporulation protein YhbH